MTDGGFAAAKVAAPLLKPAGNWVARRFRPDTSPGALDSLADNLAAAVARREAVLRDQLRGGPDKITDTAEFQDAPRFRAEDDDTPTTWAVSGIGEFFRRRTPRRLAILGQPGAGKTVLAITLLLDQLEHRDGLGGPQRAATPVPVRVNAAGWDGSGDLDSWLAARIAAAHAQNPRQVRALLDTGRILPVLDGLDEADPPGQPPDRASAILGALNEVPWINRAVVIACRAEVFTAIREQRRDAGLHQAAAITLQPIPPDQITAHLSRYRDTRGLDPDDWDPVIGQIVRHPDGPLATALSTPWLLGLAAAGLHHHHYSAADLAARADPDAIRGLLFAALIPEAIKASPTAARKWGYTEHSVHTWMRTLAGHLEHRLDRGGAAEVQLGQLWAMAGPRRTLAIAGLAVALACGLAAGLAVGLQSGLTAALLGLAAPAIGLDRGRATERLAWRVPGRRRWPGALKSGLKSGLAVGLAVGLAGGLPGGLPGGVVVVMAGVLAVAFGLAVGIYGAFATTPGDRLALGQDPHRVIRHDLVAALATGLLPVVLAASAWRLANGLAAGLLVGLWVGAASTRHAAACLVFRRSGQFPARAARFLEWGRDTGLLRVTGIAYQFRHETHRRWLLDQPATSEPAPSPRPSQKP